MQDTLIIVNPVAGKGRGEKAYKKLMHLKNISENSVIKLTDFPGHATKIARSYASAYKNVVIVGGDGTVNEVMKGLDTSKKIKIAVLPVGTGNDFASNLGKQINFQNIIDFLLNKEKYDSSKFGLYQVEFKTKNNSGTLRKTRFVNALGVGFDGLVAKIVNENKKLSGVFAYVLGVFKALKELVFLDVKYIVPKVNLLNNKNLLITIGSGKTSGGGFYLNPHGNIFEEFLEVTVISRMSKLKILKSLPLALFNKIHKVKEVIFHKTNYFEVAFRNSAVAHCDGEILSDKIVYLKIFPLKHNLEVIKFS